jgi:hypothetical protein
VTTVAGEPFGAPRRIQPPFRVLAGLSGAVFLSTLPGHLPVARAHAQHTSGVHDPDLGRW